MIPNAIKDFRCFANIRAVRDEFLMYDPSRGFVQHSGTLTQRHVINHSEMDVT
jgi:hypothetical protein